MTKDLADELERLAKENDGDGLTADDVVLLADMVLDNAPQILSALRGEQWQGIETARDALERAEQFIVNGVDLGFIRLPDADVSDPAHDTLPAIRKALRALPQPKGTSHE